MINKKNTQYSLTTDKVTLGDSNTFQQSQIQWRAKEKKTCSYRPTNLLKAIQQRKQKRHGHSSQSTRKNDCHLKNIQNNEHLLLTHNIV